MTRLIEKKQQGLMFFIKGGDCWRKIFIDFTESMDCQKVRVGDYEKSIEELRVILHERFKKEIKEILQKKFIKEISGIIEKEFGIEHLWGKVIEDLMAKKIKEVELKNIYIFPIGLFLDLKGEILEFIPLKFKTVIDLIREGKVITKIESSIN
ncbi:MAG: hypothetical protein V1651_00235 [Patescibacteria group bacterium]